MTEGANRSAWLGGPWLIAMGIAAAGAAAVFYLLGADGLGWWWDATWLAFFGMLVGQVAGLVLGSYVLGSESIQSDGPSVLGNTAGIGIMVTLWLCLPEGAVAVLGHVARTVVGAAAGALLVLVFTPDRSVAQDHV